MDGVEDEREAKRKRQVKKMTKILSKAWQLDHSEPFQEVNDDQLKMLGEGPFDLGGMGAALDDGAYPLGRKGWELFATHIGGIYNRYIICGKLTKRAREHLKQISDLLSNIDPNLADIAVKSKPKGDDNSKKRKANDDPVPDHTPLQKKKTSKDIESRSSDVSTISQREEKAMQNLVKFIKENGGNPDEVSAYRCQVTQTGDRFIPTFYSDKGKKFKSMIDVARSLGVIGDDLNGSNSILTGGKDKPKNAKDLETERKKLTRELDRLMKTHEKAIKCVDEFQNEKSKEVQTIDDDDLPFDETRNRGLWSVLNNPDLDGFPGLPVVCTQDVLMVWDFLCTFSRTLSLDPIDLDNFVTSLNYKPHPHDMDLAMPPVFLAETHMALIKLLLSDHSSDSWWWSLLETPETEASEEATKGEVDTIPPTIKIDIKALLDFEEDISVTKMWLQALEDIRSRRANAGGLIAAAVKTASSITTNPLVKLYLRKSMRGFQTYAAHFTKQSCMWLIGRVREARPDLWGRKIDPEILSAQKSKVINDAVVSMELLEDEDTEVANIDDIQFGESDEEDSDLEEDENEAPAEAMHDMVSKKKDKEQDLSAPVTTSVPTKPAPSIVDLLLPPTKPNPSASGILTPFSWPQIVGASVSRILHRYKRLRNQADDSLREFRELVPLTISQRKAREDISISRNFSECVALSDESSASSIQAAIDHLCCGKEYLCLEPLQRLCILRVLIDAAYDTEQVQQCIQDNIKSRIGAVKQLENEERRAKKEAKEASIALETQARERLAREAREALISEKKRELLRKNKHTGEYSIELIESLEVDELIDLDEDFKAEFDALPEPKQFNKNEVRAMVTKITEETAFNTTELEVLTLEEIESRENVTRQEMEEELASFENPELIFNRDISAKIAKLESELSSFKEWQESLPPERAAAMDALKDAIEDGTIKPLKSAIKLAKSALLCGDDEETGGMWTLDLLRDAQVELKQAEKKKRVIEAQKELITKRNKCFVRTEAIGKDRTYNTYWHFDHDYECRIWFDAHFKLPEENSLGTAPICEKSSIIIGAPDEEGDLKSKENEVFIRFSRQEYHPSSALATLARRHTGAISSTQSLRRLIKNLSGKGIRENGLRDVLKETLEASAAKLAPKDEINSTVKGPDQERDKIQRLNDEIVFSQAKTHALSNLLLENDIDMLSSLSSAIGQRCRLRHVEDDISFPDEATYTMGTVVGWRTKKIFSECLGSSNEDKTIPEKEVNVWTLCLDQGGEIEISSIELLHGLIRAKKWRSQHSGYFEYDSPLLKYRNKMGKFCGRAIEAQYAASSLSYSKLILKREQELYTSLKTRCKENNWGGKEGIRNSWIDSMKENFDSIKILREGLLSLEDAVFEMCGGHEADEASDGKTAIRSATDLLENEDLRCDIELESYGVKPNVLWNSNESRSVFREIMSSSTSLGILTLGLDLLYRNAQAYLESTKSTSTRNASTNYELGMYNNTGRTTRSAYSSVNEEYYSSSSRRVQPQSYSSFF